MINVHSVYMTRSMRDNKIPAMAWPFNLAEFALLLVLYTKHNGLDTAEKLQLMRMVIEFVLSIQLCYCINSLSTCLIMQFLCF